MKNFTLFWIILSIVSFVIELMTPTFFFLSVAFGALFAWLVSFAVDSLVIEIIVFLVFFFIFFYFLKPVLYKNRKEKFNSELMIGKILYTKEDIDDQKGVLELNGSNWQARSETGLIEKDCKVKIVRIDGNKLIVTKED
ncbi:MAG: NfeD family protein [Pleomorphochaeta sp.]